MPGITKKDIRDKSKASRLAKTLACLQSAQFLVSSLARVVQNLPLTTLEIGTLPFIGCTWLTYYFWWAKAVDMETSTLIYTPGISKDDLRRLAEATCFAKKSGSWYRPALKEIHSRGWDFYWFEKSTDMKTLSIVRGNNLVPSELYDFVKHSEAETRVASWYLPSVSEFLASEWDNVNDTVLVLAGWFFNGLHLAAWNSQFPTQVESLLVRYGIGQNQGRLCGQVSIPDWSMAPVTLISELRRNLLGPYPTIRKVSPADMLSGMTDIYETKLFSRMWKVHVNINLNRARPRACPGDPVRFGEIDSGGCIREVVAPFFGSRPSRQARDIEDAGHEFGTVRN
ncbi:MAG: hypothetical protein Q9210_004535 [Variospora velana]